MHSYVHPSEYRLSDPESEPRLPRLRYACHLVVDVTVTTRTVRHPGAVATACRCGILVEIVEVACVRAGVVALPDRGPSSSLEDRTLASA